MRTTIGVWDLLVGLVLAFALGLWACTYTRAPKSHTEIHCVTEEKRSETETQTDETDAGRVEKESAK